MKQLKNETKQHLEEKIIPFWKSLRDNEYGGYYSLLDFDLKLDKKANKGCILNSRIMWFFSNAYRILGEESLLDYATHSYEFLKTSFIDKKHGGVFWSVTYDGIPADDVKHTYNHAFAIYALASYYDASKNKEALDLAYTLYSLIEERCCDGIGYLESFSRSFALDRENKKLSGGASAQKTMNTILHVLEAYTELYRVTGDTAVREKLLWIVNIFKESVYNPELQRQEVFFDKNWNSIADLHSYGHDIETAWLMDETCDILGDEKLSFEIKKITSALENKVYEKGYRDHSIMFECENGVDNTKREWWGQAEAVVGFINAYQKSGDEKFRTAAYDVWEYIKNYLIDKRPGSEWFWSLDENRKPSDNDIVNEWKCPYHNSRMCFELIKREREKTK